MCMVGVCRLDGVCVYVCVCVYVYVCVYVCRLGRVCVCRLGGVYVVYVFVYACCLNVCMLSESVYVCKKEI